jgi:hypothetical protein
MRWLARGRLRPCVVRDRFCGGFEHGILLTATNDLQNRKTDLLPKPKAIASGSLMAGFSFPSKRKRSGLNKSGSGNAVYLQLGWSENRRLGTTNFIVEHGPGRIVSAEKKKMVANSPHVRNDDRVGWDSIPLIFIFDGDIVWDRCRIFSN